MRTKACILSAMLRRLIGNGGDAAGGEQSAVGDAVQHGGHFATGAFHAAKVAHAEDQKYIPTTTIAAITHTRSASSMMPRV